jgi:hypothetical protein
MSGLPVPVLLALLTIAVLTVAIFAPRRAATRARVSLGPPLATVPVERWAPPGVEPFANEGYVTSRQAPRP